MPPTRYYCSVPKCQKDPLHTVFGLPKDPSLAEVWINQLNMDENYIKNSRKIYVCEAHFDSETIFETKTKQKRLQTSTYPTLNLPSKESYQEIKNYDRKRRPNNIINKLIRKADGANEIREASVITPQENNIYNDLVESKSSSYRNSISPIMELIPSSSQNNISPVMELAPIKTILFTNRKINNKNAGNLIKRKKRPENVTNQAHSDPDYTSKTISEVQNQIKELASVSGAQEQLSLTLNMMYPHIYKMLHTCLQLPFVSLKRGIFDGSSNLTDDDTLFSQALQMKVTNMSEKEKHCVICLGEIEVSGNLYYDITCDKILGIADLNNIQKPELAHKALVLTVQGIFSDWIQPIAIAYVGNREFTEYSNNNIKEWIDRNICNSLKIGYKVRAYVSDTNYYYLMERYQIEQCTYNIYCIYDVSSLIKLFYYNFSTYDYRITGGVAKMQHILDYYNLDRIKQLRLTPKLTEKHVKLPSCNNLSIDEIKEVLSLQTAAAMSTYIDFGALDQSAKSTVQFIKDMSTLQEVLLSNNCNDSIKVDSGKTYIEFLRYMLLFFNNVRLINPSLKTDKPKVGTFVEKMQMTIKSVLLLYEDIKLNNDSKTLPTRRLSLDYLRSFFDNINTSLSNKPTTCRKIDAAFKKSTILNVLKSTSKINDLEINMALDQTMQLIKDSKNFTHQFGEGTVSSDMKIKTSEYRRLDLRTKDGIILLAGFILKKCHDRHADCIAMKNYVCIVMHDTSSICKPILDEIQKGICVVPQESFIEFVEMMEIRFRSFMTKGVLETSNGKLIKGLLAAMRPVCFPVPCQCFPILFAKKLYLRVRLYNMLKYNNTLMCTGISQSELVINNL